RDARPERVARLVDDRLEELLPRARGRGHARDSVQEAELVELLRRGLAVADRLGFGLPGLRHPATIAEARGAPGDRASPRRARASWSRRRPASARSRLAAMWAGQPPGRRPPITRRASGSDRNEVRLSVPCQSNSFHSAGRSVRGSFRPWLVTSGRTPSRRSSRT